MIYITGDLHNYIDSEKLFIPSWDKDDIIIVCGDFGYVWDYRPERWKEEQKFRNELMEHLGCTLLWVDGNHECFDHLERFIITEKFGGKVQKVAPNCYHLMRGETFNINGYKFLTLGGADSHDKEWRKEGINWWPQERITDADIKKAVRNCNDIDFIITHCAPDSFQRKLFIINNIPISVYKEDTSSQKLEKLLKKISLQEKEWKWFMGHYHFDQDYDPFYVMYNKFYCVEEGKWLDVHSI